MNEKKKNTQNLLAFAVSWPLPKKKTNIAFKNKTKCSNERKDQKNMLTRTQNITKMLFFSHYNATNVIFCFKRKEDQPKVRKLNNKEVKT